MNRWMLPCMAAGWMAAWGAGCVSPRPETRPLPRIMAEADPTQAGLQMGMPWTGWDDAREPALVFKSEADWKPQPGAAFKVVRTDFTHDQPTGRWSWSGGESQLERAEPGWIREPFNALELWAALPETPRTGASDLEIQLVVTGARGKTERWTLGTLHAAGGWQRLHLRMPRTFLSGSAEPYRVECLQAVPVAGGGGDHEIFLGYLTAYIEQLTPIVADWRRDESLYLNPVRKMMRGPRPGWPGPDSIAPAGPASTSAVSRIQRDAKTQDWLLSCEDGTRAWGYRLMPERWWTDGVDLVERDLPAGPWRTVAHWRGFDMPSAPMSGCRKAGNELVIVRTDGWTAKMSLLRGSLCIEIKGPPIRTFTLVSLGLDAPGGCRALEIPLYNEGRRGPATLIFRENDPDREPLVATGYFDPRASAASSLSFLRMNAWQTPQWAEARYEAGDSDALSRVRERWFLSFADRLCPLLPRYEKSPDAASLPLFWRSSDPVFAKAQQAILAEQGWPETPMLPAADFCKEAGHWTCGDGMEVNDQWWTRDAIRRDTSGQWVRDSNGRPRAKWPFLLLWTGDDLHAQTNGGPARGPGRMPLTAVAPWEATDFDPRSLNPGQFAEAYRAAAGMLAELRAAGRRPMLAEADYGWLYADLADSLWSARADLRKEARLPVFGYQSLAPSCPITLPIADAKEELASVLSFAAVPALMVSTSAVEIARIAAVAHSVLPCMRKQAPARAGMQDGRSILSSLEIISGGSVRAGRLYLAYPGPFELCINNAVADEWNAELGGASWVLPPGGWVALGPDVLACDVKVPQGRMFAVLTETWAFWDGPDGAALKNWGGGVPFLARALPEKLGWTVLRLAPDSDSATVRLPVPRSAAGAWVSRPGNVETAPWFVRAHEGSVQCVFPAGAKTIEIHWAVP